MQNLRSTISIDGGIMASPSNVGSEISAPSAAKTYQNYLFAEHIANIKPPQLRNHAGCGNTFSSETLRNQRWLSFRSFLFCSIICRGAFFIRAKAYHVPCKIFVVQMRNQYGGLKSLET
jgi:hypothetical protein